MRSQREKRELVLVDVGVVVVCKRESRMCEPVGLSESVRTGGSEAVVVGLCIRSVLMSFRRNKRLDLAVDGDGKRAA